MAVSVEQLRAYIGVTDPTPEDDEHLSRSLAVGAAVVDSYLEQAFKPVPEDLRDQVLLDAAHGVFKRRDSVSGASQYAYDGGALVFDPKDLLQRWMPTLRRYVLPF